MLTTFSLTKAIWPVTDKDIIRSHMFLPVLCTFIKSCIFIGLQFFFFLLWAWWLGTGSSIANWKSINVRVLICLITYSLIWIINPFMTLLSLSLPVLSSYKKVLAILISSHRVLTSGITFLYREYFIPSICCYILTALVYILM